MQMSALRFIVAQLMRCVVNVLQFLDTFCWMALSVYMVIMFNAWPIA